MLAVARLPTTLRVGRVAAAPILGRAANVLPCTAAVAVKSRALSTSGQVMTEQDVLNMQKTWSDGVIAIGKAFMEGGDYKGMAKGAASTIYGYDYGPVLFKPTRCAEVPFRPKPEDALSYFVGGHIAEDKGFAIQPWSHIKWDNHGIYCSGDVGIAMGEYYFTDAKTSAVSKVEYTFGYRKHADGEIRIFLHHSSVPYKP